MEEKILTLHPQGKRGVNISRSKYESMKKTILEILGKAELTHAELTAAVEKKLKGKFDGSIPWYMEGTKLDLEARGVIQRIPGEKHDVYRVKR
ncbi:MAG TPA: hypothetical protein VK189_08510 [Thermoplasmata archaeon]|nr:hypothetical protein [Thermoplasmata archaeon]